MLASVATRPVFWHFVVWLKVIWYLLAAASVVVFAYGVARPLVKYRHGRGDQLPSARELPRLLRRGLRELLEHVTIARRDATAGWAHGAIFYGFIVLFAGTVILGFDTDFTDPVFGWSYFHGGFYLAYKETLNAFGTALIAGVLVMMLRRAVLRPAKLDYSRPDRAPGDPQFDRRLYEVGDWVFVGTLLVIALTGFALEGVRIAMDTPGYGATQFGGWIVAQALTGVPHATLAGIRHGLWWFHGLLALTFVASIPYTKAAHMLTSFFSLALRDPLAGKRLRAIPPDRAAQPAGYATLADFSPLHLLQLDANLQSTLEVIHKSGNSFGENKRKRGRWTAELDFEVPDARRQPVDVLWFVGDYASFDPRSQRVTRSLARLFHEGGVDFGILYDGERNSGNDVRRVGEEGLFEMLAEENIATLGGCEFKRIVTSDPHSLNTLRNEYPELGGSWSVMHHTTFLLELIDAGSLKLPERLSYRVTYHDPCHLGRMNGEYDAPRQILERLGCTLIEMPRNRDNSFCCGAGGGRIWIADPPGAERPAENRIREAVGLPGVELFVVACPKDVTMYEDAIKTSGNAGKLELRELTELVEEALAGQPALAASA